MCARTYCTVMLPELRSQIIIPSHTAPLAQVWSEEGGSHPWRTWRSKSVLLCYPGCAQWLSEGIGLQCWTTSTRRHCFLRNGEKKRRVGEENWRSTSLIGGEQWWLTGPQRPCSYLLFIAFHMPVPASSSLISLWTCLERWLRFLDRFTSCPFAVSSRTKTCTVSQTWAKTKSPNKSHIEPFFPVRANQNKVKIRSMA